MYQFHNDLIKRLRILLKESNVTLHSFSSIQNSVLIHGYQIFHNYVRPHMGLNGQTTAQACGIDIQGDNKWMTLIQNASRREV